MLVFSRVVCFLPFDHRIYGLRINKNPIHNNHTIIFFPFQFDDATLFLLQHQFCNNYNYLKSIRSNEKNDGTAGL
jgi:hypothetical protein